MAPDIAVFDDHSKDNRTMGALGKTTSGKRLKIRTYPKFSSLEEERLYRKQHLAVGVPRILHLDMFHPLTNSVSLLHIVL